MTPTVVPLQHKSSKYGIHKQKCIVAIKIPIQYIWLVISSDTNEARQPCTPATYGIYSGHRS